MAEPLRNEPAPIDPSAIAVRYRYHRAMRRARVLRREESRLARYRYYIALTVLMVIAGTFVVGVWHQIQHLFGL